MKYSVCIDAVFGSNFSFIDAMKKVKEAGYDAFEFWSWWDKDIEEIIKHKEELNLEVATFCTKFINPGDKELQNQYIEGLKDSISIAKKLNCSTIITQTGFDFESSQKGIVRKEHRKTFLETLKIAAEILERENVTLVVEPLNLLVDHPGYHLVTSDDAFDLIDRIGSNNIKVLFDIYHQQITEGNLIENITHNIQKIGHFHAAGNPGRTELTKGEIHYKHVFKAINEKNYKGYVGLEYMTDVDPGPGLIETKKEILV